MHQRFRNVSVGLILTVMISSGIHAQAQRLLDSANPGRQGFVHPLQAMPDTSASVTQGNYIPFNSGGEPGVFGVVIGLAAFVGGYFTLRRRPALRTAPQTFVPVASAVYSHDAVSTVGAAETAVFTTPLRSYHPTSSQPLVSSGN